jgi:UDPglucose 6-dehydrogenase
MFKKFTKVGIVGVGMVGGSMQRYFEKKHGLEIFLYDKGKGLGSPEEINKAEIIFVCVPTPYLKDGKGFDLSYVEGTLALLQGEKVVVIKSTVLPGTTEMLQQKYPQHKILMNPEFLTEETADQDMLYPDRQVVGYTAQSHNVAGDVMQLLPLAPFERMLPATEAELVKYFGNTWFSVKVSFANQMYDLCQSLGVDYDRMVEAAAADKRIGRTHLNIFHKGGRGYGGKCLPKDIKALIQLATSKGVDLKVHKAAEEVNEALMKMQGIDDAEKKGTRPGF